MDDAPEVTLDEFCLRLSATDKRVEMIAGFYASQKRAGTVKATESDLSSRYAAFISQPV